MLFKQNKYITMTPKSPEEQAAELYPTTIWSDPFNIVEKQRAAWLSRQAEVDELKKQIEEVSAAGSSINNKYVDCRYEVDELKRQVEELKQYNERKTTAFNNMVVQRDEFKSLYYEVFDNANEKLAAKEKEIAELKRQVEELSNNITLIYYKYKILGEVNELREELAAKEKEIAEFAEWCSNNDWVLDTRTWVNWDESGNISYKTTPELLKQFRDNKNQKDVNT
jgi:peptidoglycan hydrolase CwlO-like protein